MKKVLLSLSMLAAVMAANAQTHIPVGLGAQDDFTTQGPAQNLTGEYSSTFTYEEVDYTSGIFWWKDTAPANADDYTPVRSGGVYTISVDKAKAYSPFGFGFGDTEGDGTGTPFSIDITNAKTISFKAKATEDPGYVEQDGDGNDITIEPFFPSLFIQVSDANGINGEIRLTGAGDDAKYGEVALTEEFQTLSYDLTGMQGQTLPDAQGGSMWPCVDYPADCPDRSKASDVDFSKITKVSFFVSGGKRYTGTVVLDDVAIGTSSQLGLGTKSAAANLASTKVFPNPTENEFYVELNTKNNASATIIVSDLMGKQVATKTAVNGVNTKFETAGLAKGMYTVTYVLDGTPAKTELVVVK